MISSAVSFGFFLACVLLSCHEVSTGSGKKIRMDLNRAVTFGCLVAAGAAGISYLVYQGRKREKNVTRSQSESDASLHSPLNHIRKSAEDELDLAVKGIYINLYLITVVKFSFNQIKLFLS